jgi:hypothetical protein
MPSLSLSAPVDKPLTDSRAGSGKPVTITHDGKTRTVGYAMPNGAWYRRMERSRHFYRTGGEAIAASRAALMEAQRLGCKYCKVVDAESGDTYLCSFGDYELYGRPIHRPGWEPQVALNLTYWHIIRRDGTQIQSWQEQRAAQAAPVAPEPAVEQMSLFAAGD